MSFDDSFRKDRVLAITQLSIGKKPDARTRLREDTSGIENPIVGPKSD
jgi:hypothetical protein